MKELPRSVDGRIQPPVDVVALCGSRRDGSYTKRALDEVLSEAQTAGGATAMLDLGSLELPIFDPDCDDPQSAQRLQRSLRNADAVILGTPMYHGSYSGALKNALDYCGFEEFEDTTVGLLVVSGGAFPTGALAHLRSVCRSLNAWVLPHQVAVPQAHAVFADDELADEDIRDRLRDLGRHAVAFGRIEPTPVRTPLGQEA